MKIVFVQHEERGLILVQAECDTLDEADQFQAWFEAKVNGAANQPELPLPPVTKAKAETHDEIKSVQEKVTRADLSKAAIALVQTKGRSALEPILQRYNAKRISEISEDNIVHAFADVREAQ